MRKYLMAVVAIATFATGNWAIGAVGYEDPNRLAIESAPRVAVATYTPETLKRSFTLHERTTATPWTEGRAVRFRGPYLKDVLKEYGLDDEPKIEVFAFDHFVTRIRQQEIDTYNPILAIERACTQEDRKEGRCSKSQEFMPLPMEDAGPFFIVWPIEKLPPSYVPARNSVWVWFVVALRPVS